MTWCKSGADGTVRMKEGSLTAHDRLLCCPLPRRMPDFGVLFNTGIRRFAVLRSALPILARFVVIRRVTDPTNARNRHLARAGETGSLIKALLHHSPGCRWLCCCWFTWPGRRLRTGAGCRPSSCPRPRGWPARLAGARGRQPAAPRRLTLLEVLLGLLLGGGAGHPAGLRCWPDRPCWKSCSRPTWSPARPSRSWPSPRCW